MSNTTNKPEILAPVGHIEAFYSAINAGCDAVYLGGHQFGARDYAKNFDHEMLLELVPYAHLRDVRVYYTLNTLIKDIELKKLHKELEFLNTLCLDALIIQDLGVFEYIRTNFPDFILHGSTQMNIHNSEDARFFNNLGFERVVLARECRLSDIQSIIKNVPIEIETFVHGALCYSFSGQCLMSSFYGGRSGNRGKCAGPCRLPFNIEKVDGYFLSMKDQMVLEILPQLIISGIDSFKIEGRMKSAEYVFFTTYLYKKYRELAQRCIDEGRLNDYSVDPRDIDLLKTLYNRGNFTEGYYMDQAESQISQKHPKHLGLYVGYAKYSDKGLLLTLDKKLFKGDVLEWHIPTINFDDNQYPTTTVDEAWSKKNIRLNNNTYIVKEIRKHIVDHKAIIEIYKIFDPRFTGQMDELKMKKKIKVDSRLSVKIGQPLRLDMSYTDNNKCIKAVSIEGFIVEKAQKRSLDEEIFIKQFNKTEGGVFEFCFGALEIEANAFAPIGAINQLRRDAITRLETNTLDAYWKERVPFQLKNQRGTEYFKKSAQNIFGHIGDYRVSIRTVKQWEGLKLSYKNTAHNYKIDRLYIDLTDLTEKEINQVLNEKSEIEKETKFYLCMPHVIFESYQEKMLDILDAIDMPKVDGFLIRSLGQIEFLAPYNKPIASDYNLHVFNYKSAEFLRRYVQTITLSAELNARGMEDIINRVQDMDIEWIGYGHIALMHSSTCVYKSRYGKCMYSSKGHHIQIKDRKQETQEVASHCKFCYSSIYNAKASNVLDYVQQLKGKSRIEFTFESKEDVNNLMKQIDENRTIFFDDALMTKGHIQSGVK